MEKLRSRKTRLKWTRIGETADILRGEIISPVGAKQAVHTTNYKDGFWSKSGFEKYLRRGKSADRRIRVDDILVKRVGKDCSKTFGRVTDVHGHAASDCIVIIRPHKPKENLKMLFALRCILGAEVGASLLERGTGAPYLTVAELPLVELPSNLSTVYPDAFSNYKRAVSRRSFNDMLTIEQYVRTKLS
jgi:hypothetical protein